MHLGDLLAAVALAGFVFAATLTVFAQGQLAYLRGTARVESQQSARLALARMAREIRQAGSGPGALSPITVAEPERIVIQRDGRSITWQVSAGVLRRNAGAGAQPIINGLRGLTLEYRDASGRPTTFAAAVRAVVITITTAPEHSGPGAATLTRLTTEVRLRNR